MSVLNKDNPLFEAARRGRRLPNIFLMMVVLLVLLFIAFGATGIIGKLIYDDPDNPDAYYDSMLFLLAPFTLLVVGLWGWMAAYEKRPFWTVGLPVHGWLKKYLLGLLIGFGMLSLIVALMAAAGAVTFDDSTARQHGIAGLGSVLLFLLAMIVQGGSEEVVIRGWMLQTIGARYRPIVGVIVANSLFVAFHGSIDPIVVINLVLFSLFVTFYCFTEGSIWGVCGWHAAWNWSQGYFYGLSVTGHEQVGGTVVDLKTAGTSLLSGGDFGPEASIMCTVVLVAGIAVIIVKARGKSLH
ncbi:MAG: CPBP family intramembrane metalloprotease [bacterium]|nr:MAG: CPBP family intramembrane metalloprotease [bacterium]